MDGPSVWKYNHGFSFVVAWLKCVRGYSRFGTCSTVLNIVSTDWWILRSVLTLQAYSWLSYANASCDADSVLVCY